MLTPSFSNEEFIAELQRILSRDFPGAPAIEAAAPATEAAAAAPAAEAAEAAPATEAAGAAPAAEAAGIEAGDAAENLLQLVAVPAPALPAPPVVQERRPRIGGIQQARSGRSCCKVCEGHRSRQYAIFVLPLCWMAPAVYPLGMHCGCA